LALIQRAGCLFYPQRFFSGTVEGKTVHQGLAGKRLLKGERVPMVVLFWSTFAKRTWTCGVTSASAGEGGEEVSGGEDCDARSAAGPPQSERGTDHLRGQPGERSFHFHEWFLCRLLQQPLNCTFTGSL